MMPVLEQWVEQKKAPGKVIARNEKGQITHPLCPFPQVAVYRGKGDFKDEKNFACKTQ
jgi:feruloyl esterase